MLNCALCFWTASKPLRRKHRLSWSGNQPHSPPMLPVCVFLRGMQRKHISSLTFIYLSPSVSHPLSTRRESCFVDRGHLSVNGSDVMRLVRLDRPHFTNRPKGQCISIASIQTWHSFPWLRPSMGDPILEKPNHQPLIPIKFIRPGFILHFSHFTCYWAQTVSSRSQFNKE